MAGDRRVFIMKFTITTADMQDVISKMGRLIGAKTTVPILAGVLVKAQDGLLIFTASDGDESIIHRLSMDKTEGNEIIEEGTAVFLKETFDVIRKLKKGSVTFDVADTTVAVIQDKTNLEFPLMIAADYPNIQMPDNKKPLVLSGAEFAHMVSQTTFAAAKRDLRPILMGVHMTFAKDSCQFVCTDSHRLGRLITKGIDSLEESLSITVPASILDHAIKSFDLSQDVILLPDNQIIALANGNTILLSPLFEGSYPDTNRLIPTEFSSELVANRKEFVEGLELLQVLSTENVVHLKTNGMFVELRAAGADAKGQREIAFESYEGEEGFSIAFSPQYALDALKRMESESVRFRFTESMRPFLAIPETVNSVMNDCIQLILPVRR